MRGPASCSPPRGRAGAAHRHGLHRPRGRGEPRTVDPDRARLRLPGQLCIHPKQVGPVNRVFTPSADAVAQAEKHVAAFREAEAAGLGLDPGRRLLHRLPDLREGRAGAADRRRGQAADAQVGWKGGGAMFMSRGLQGVAAAPHAQGLCGRRRGGVGRRRAAPRAGRGRARGHLRSGARCASPASPGGGRGEHGRRGQPLPPHQPLDHRPAPQARSGAPRLPAHRLRPALSHPGRLNAIHQATWRMDQETGGTLHERFLAYLHRVQADDLALGVAMTDGKGDRLAPPPRTGRARFPTSTSPAPPRRHRHQGCEGDRHARPMSTNIWSCPAAT